MKSRAIKKVYIKYVKLWNQFVIQAFLILIWLFILTPTALIRRMVQNLFSAKSKKPESFFKKSAKIDPDHFLRPF